MFSASFYPKIVETRNDKIFNICSKTKCVREAAIFVTVVEKNM